MRQPDRSSSGLPPPGWQPPVVDLVWEPKAERHHSRHFRIKVFFPTIRSAPGILAHLEQQAAFATAEIKRLQERRAFFERAIEKMEGYVIHIIESIGPDAKGKYPKLEGRTVTFSIKDCPPSVVIQDEAAIPSDYKAITVTMPALKWQAFLDSLDMEQRANVLDWAEKPKVAVSKTAIKKGIDGGAQIPGADLIVGKKTLIRK